MFPTSGTIKSHSEKFVDNKYLCLNSIIDSNNCKLLSPAGINEISSEQTCSTDIKNTEGDTIS